MINLYPALLSLPEIYRPVLGSLLTGIHSTYLSWLAPERYFTVLSLASPEQVFYRPVLGPHS